MTTAFRIAQANLNEEASTSERAPTLAPTATRQGQREIVAATLAAGIISADGKAVTPEEAATLMTEMLEQLPGPHAATPKR